MQFGLIGKSLVHSFSAAYFQAKFEKLHLSDYRYLNCELPSIDELSSLLADGQWQGFNVTIPYKEACIPFLDGLSPDAQSIGAVNTLVCKGDTWWGYNTDHLGFRRALEEAWPQMKVNKALVLGSGGASKAVNYALEQMEIESQIVSRNPTKEQIDYQEAQFRIQEFPLIINTSPLGTFPEVEVMPPLEPKGDLSGHYFMDLIYNPEETLWLQKARAAGASVLNGKSMLVYQAEAAWKLWQDQ